MAILNLGLTEADASNDTDFEPLPIAEYTVMIKSTTTKEGEFRTTKNGGTAIPIVFEVVDGTHKGRLIFENINIVNANPKAESIAKSTLAKISIAAGIKPQDLSDTAQIEGKIIKVLTKVKPESVDKNTGKVYKADTAVDKYININGGTTLPSMFSQTAPEQTQSAPVSDKPPAMPWDTK